MNPERQTSETLIRVPAVPAAIRYYDDFCDSYVHLANPGAMDVWTIQLDGGSANLDFTRIEDKIRPLVKAWCANVLGTLSPVTAEYYLRGIQRVPAESLMAVIMSSPQSV